MKYLVRAHLSGPVEESGSQVGRPMDREPHVYSPTGGVIVDLYKEKKGEFNSIYIQSVNIDTWCWWKGGSPNGPKQSSIVRGGGSEDE